MKAGMEPSKVSSTISSSLCFCASSLEINALTMVVGLILVLAVAFLGSIGAVSSVYVALFQLFWLLPIYLITKFLLM